MQEINELAVLGLTQKKNIMQHQERALQLSA